MKYLKRFNEELDPKTYKRAADVLSGLGHFDRAKQLSDYSYTRLKQDILGATEEFNKVYDKYGKLNIRVPNGDIFGTDISANFILQFEEDWTEDTIISTEYNILSFNFFLLLIPNEEMIDNLIKNYKGNYNKQRFIQEVIDGMSRGFTEFATIQVRYDADIDKFIFKDILIDPYEYNDFIFDRKSALKIKRMLESFFSKNIPNHLEIYENYPTNFSDRTPIRERILDIFLGNDMSSEYAAVPEDVAEDIRKYSVNNLYK